MYWILVFSRTAIGLIPSMDLLRCTRSAGGPQCRRARTDITAPVATSESSLVAAVWPGSRPAVVVVTFPAFLAAAIVASLEPSAVGPLADGEPLRVLRRRRGRDRAHAGRIDGAGEEEGEAPAEVEAAPRDAAASTAPPRRRLWRR